MNYYIDDFNVQIVENPASFSLDVYFWRKREGTEIVEILQANGGIKESVIGSQQKHIPTFVASRGLLGKLMNAIAKEGIKDPEKSFVEGELVATKSHLEDMRKLVFKIKQ